MGRGRARGWKTPEGVVRVRVHQPAASEWWKEQVYVQALAMRPEPMLEGALALAVTFYLERPKSARKKDWWPKRGDCDNYVKAVLDALQGLYFRNDNQIVRLVVEKRFGDPPRVRVTVEELDHERTTEGVADHLG